MTSIQERDSRTLTLSSAEIDAATFDGRVVAEWRTDETHVDLVHYDDDGDRVVLESTPRMFGLTAAGAIRAMHDLLDEELATHVATDRDTRA